MPILDLLGLALLGLALALRPLAGGFPYLETETSVIHLLVWAAALVALAAPFGASASPLPAPGASAPPALSAGVFRRLRMPFLFYAALALAAAGAALAAARALSAGHGQLALDQAGAWLGDLLLFFVVVHHARHPERFRYLLACLMAGFFVASAYSVFQVVYGNGYFRHLYASRSGIADAMAGADETSRELFRYRVESPRATGPFGYANALGGFALLFLPAAALLWLRPSPKRRLAGQTVIGAVTLAGFFALAYSGGAGAILAGKAAEVLGLAAALPARERWGRLRALAAAAGWTTAATAIAAAAALALGGGYARLAGRPDWFAPLSQTLFAFGWMAEIALWRRWREDRIARPGAEALRQTALAVAGWLLIAAGIVVGVRLASGLDDKMLNDRRPASAAGTAEAAGTDGTASEAAASRAERWRASAGKTMLVRWGYWRAALAMAADHPWRGVGLDNFGQRYPEYKTVAAWPVRRAHNLYLQWLADGGLALFLPAMAVIGLYFLRLFRPEGSPDLSRASASAAAAPLPPPRAARNPQRGMERGDDRSGDGLAFAGSAVGPFALLLVYLLYPDTFGLAYEYVRIELWGGPESGALRATTGEPGPLLFMAFVSFALLPAAWIAAFLAVRGAARPDADAGSHAFWRLALGLGVAASLLHGLTDFIHSTAAISTALAALAGLGWAVSSGSAAVAVPAAGAASASSRSQRPRSRSGQRPWEGPDDHARAGENLSEASRPTGRPTGMIAWRVLAFGGLIVFFLGFLHPNYRAALLVRTAELSVDEALRIASAERRAEERRKALSLAENALLEARLYRGRDPDLERKAGRIAFLLAVESAWNAMRPQEREGLYRDSVRQIQEKLARRAPEAMKDLALRHFARACRLDPQYAAEYAEWARYLERFYPYHPDLPENLGRLREAAALWKEATRLHPTRASYWLSRADLAKRLGDRDLAVDAARRALEMDLGNTDIAAVLSDDDIRLARLLAGGQWERSAY